MSYKWLAGDNKVWKLLFYGFTKAFVSVPHKAFTEKLYKPLASMSTCAMDYRQPHKPYAVCCSECHIFKASPYHFQCAPGSVLGPLLFSSMELLSYYHLRASRLCMPCKHLTINSCSRMLKYLRNGLTITIWHLTLRNPKQRYFQATHSFSPFQQGLHWNCWQC